MTLSPLLVILGPTAVGKTAVAVRAALRLNGEIVSCDSMQIYRFMDIGTAKPSFEERDAVTHHLVDIAEPEERYDVSRFLREAEKAIEDIRSRDRMPIVVGGTPMYLKALLFGIFDGPPADQELRDRLKEEAEKNGVHFLWNRLKDVDPDAAARIHENDLRRTIRALEVYEKTGTPISLLQQQWRDSNPARDAFIVGLSRSREAIHQRVDRRIDMMFDTGLVTEVYRLKDRLGPTAGRALGYAEVLRHLGGEYPLENTVEAVKNNTHNFVRKQMTWYRSLKDVTWLVLRDDEPADETAERIVCLMDRPGRIALGIDPGSRRIGLAVSDGLGLTAQGLETIERTGDESADIDLIMKAAGDRAITDIVVGRPLAMNGSKGDAAQEAERFANAIGERTGLPVHMWDERLSTALVEKMMLGADVSRKKRKGSRDRLAAQVILQSWLDANRKRTDA